MKKMIVCLAAAVSLVWAGAINAKVTLFQPSTLNGVELKPGDYRIQVDGEKLTMQSGKTKAEAAVKSEQGEQKFGSTSIRYQNGEGKMKITEIRIGGTNTKLIVN
ncbi:MAG TPA: hypothetical protein VFQ91_04990 [Bryobacteraceae bacterium]|nr:hypothetical protein [Bryobacteraceae bacterium]